MTRPARLSIRPRKRIYCASSGLVEAFGRRLEIDGPSLGRHGRRDARHTDHKGQAHGLPRGRRNGSARRGRAIHRVSRAVSCGSTACVTRKNAQAAEKIQNANVFITAPGTVDCVGLIRRDATVVPAALQPSLEDSTDWENRDRRRQRCCAVPIPRLNLRPAKDHPDRAPGSAKGGGSPHTNVAGFRRCPDCL